MMITTIEIYHTCKLHCSNFTFDSIEDNVFAIPPVGNLFKKIRMLEEIFGLRAIPEKAREL